MKGRPLGKMNDMVYHWKVTTLDKETGEISVDKYCSINEFNKKTGYKFTADHIYKIKKLTQEDIQKALENPKPRCFASMYGHLTFEKIKEPVIYERIRISLYLGKIYNFFKID